MQNDAGKTALGLDLNIGSLVCYLNICLPFGLIYSIIVLVQDKTHKLPRFHAFQSLFLTAVAIVLFIINVIVQAVGAAISIALDSSIVSLLFSLVALVLGLLGLVIFVFVVIAAIKAFQGEIYKIPVIGNMAEKYAS